MGENNGRLAKKEFETQAVRMFSAPSVSENTLTLQLLFTSAAHNEIYKNTMAENVILLGSLLDHGENEIGENEIEDYGKLACEGFLHFAQA